MAPHILTDKNTALSQIFVWVLLVCSIPAIAQQSVIATVVGTHTSGYTGDGGPASAAQVSTPVRIAMDPAGNMYLCDWGNVVIRKINTSGIITTVAGNGVIGYNGDGGNATNASINSPLGIAVDAAGNIYIADEVANVIRKVNASGVISTYAGTGVSGYNGDGIAATTARLSGPIDLEVDAIGNLYVVDRHNYLIRMIDTARIIHNIAGVPGSTGNTGTGGPATAAKFGDMVGMTRDNAGNIYVAESNPQHAVRKIDPSGMVTHIAGDDSSTITADGSLAVNTYIGAPADIAVDDTGNVYISIELDNVIKKVNTSGIISTVAGINHIAGYSGDGGLAVAAKFNSPFGLLTDHSGNLFVTDVYNNVIRKIYARPLGIEQVTDMDGLFIYPNPSDGSLNLHSRSAIGVAELTLTDMAGRKVFHTTVAVGKDDVHIALPQDVVTGMYIVLVRQGSMVSSSMLRVSR